MYLTIGKLRELCNSDSFLPDFVLRDNDKDESVIRIEPVMQTSTNTMTEFIVTGKQIGRAHV